MGFWNWIFGIDNSALPPALPQEALRTITAEQI